MLVSTEGRVIIDDTVTGFQELFESLKAIGARTPEAGLIQKPWFQGLLTVVVIVLGVAFVFGIYLYFWET